ncbi:FlgB family protein [Paracoccus sp. MBLB3053]|uniref:Flagellar basal body rod protein FlgB n=1 Tax=Paracoccus aurantius TaxID=3073814 RepID=A0ABU2HMQ7_9RHOB|nr:FlgB family protein [Paracoccus sp. MBLB3053]MDS9466311.1 FlgB family protein [Paracoccus sp. MBLB3053]
MFDRIETLRMAGALTAHATQRQKLIAENVANSDTPGFRARDVEGFSDQFRSGGGFELRMTDGRHLNTTGWIDRANVRDAGGEPAPNGNTVSLEEEMVRSADARRAFDLSVAVTRSALSLIRTSLGHRA